jgi:hypothetical protein
VGIVVAEASVTAPAPEHQQWLAFGTTLNNDYSEARQSQHHQNNMTTQLKLNHQPRPHMSITRNWVENIII